MIRIQGRYFKRTISIALVPIGIVVLLFIKQSNDRSSPPSQSPNRDTVSDESRSDSSESVRASTAETSSQIPEVRPGQVPDHNIVVQSLLGQSVHRSLNNQGERFSIIETDTELGNLLLIESLDGTLGPAQSELYSAEHFILSIGSEENRSQILQELQRQGYAVTRPFAQSELRYVNAASDDPDQFLNAFNAVKEFVGNRGTVELDGVGSGGAIPNDPLYHNQWHHPVIRSPEAWRITRGSEDIVVAVLDTGLNVGLSEFAGRTLPGYDFANNDADPDDDHNHGTVVAGTVAASANNGTLGAGLDWKCKIMPVKVLGSNNLGQWSWYAAGIDYAVENGANVINFSIGGSGTSALLTEAIDNAIENGCIFVTITYNDSKDVIRFPGNLEQCITVGAVESDGSKADFSNWGPRIDLVAPGRDILSVDKTGGPASWWGTSFAAPQVAGAASLLLSINPDLRQREVEMLLIAGATDQAGGSNDVPGFDSYYGWGRLDILNTLSLAQIAPTINTLPDGSRKLTWKSPPSAARNDSFRIQFSDGLNDWSTLESPAIEYYEEQAVWIDNGSETAIPPNKVHERFYRIVTTRPQHEAPN